MNLNEWRGKKSVETLFSVKNTAQVALDKWMSRSLKRLPFEEVQYHLYQAL